MYNQNSKTNININPTFPQVKVKVNSNVRGFLAFCSAVCASLAGYGIYKRDYRLAGTCGSSAVLFGGAFKLVDHTDKKHELALMEVARAKRPECPAREEKMHEEEDFPLIPVTQNLKEICDKARSGSKSYESDQLIGKLLSKGDRAIVYAPYGVGKTVFSMQMAKDIAEGNHSLLAPEDNGEHIPQMVVYYDGELDDKDYWNIFGNTDFSSSSNLKPRRNFKFKTIGAWLEDVKRIIDGSSGDLTIFLDNITCVCSTASAETIRDLFLYKLKPLQDKMKNERGVAVTFVIIAHTNKQLELAGSNNLGNFATAVLGLKKSGSSHIILTVHKCRKYGDLQGKHFLLEKKQAKDGYKYDQCVGEGVPKEVETEQEDELSTWDETIIPLEVVQDMYDFYEPGVSGHGLEPTIKKFETEKYGIKYSTQLSRLFGKYEDYLNNQSQE